MRRQINVVALAISSMIVVAFVVPIGMLVQSRVENRLLSSAQRDAQAVATAFAVAAPPDAGEDELAQLSSDIIASFTSTVNVSLFLPDGRLSGAPAEDDDNVQRAFAGAAFTIRGPDGFEAFVPVAFSGGRSAVVRAFASDQDLDQTVRLAWGVLAVLAAILVTVSLMVADRMGREIVGPVRAVAEATRRFDRRGAVRVPLDGPPEIVEVARSYNDLADRLERLLEAERESIADLSHRLRTPMTALRLAADRLPDVEGRPDILREIESLEEAVGQMIQDARRPVGAEAERCDLIAVVRERVEFWRILATDQRRPMSADLQAARAPVFTSAREVGAAFDVLIDNVFAHTPPGTGLRVQVSRRDGLVELSVEDDGPGFGASAVERGASGGGSTGLGLDIVRQLADRAGGHLRIERVSPHGTRVAVTLPSVGDSIDGLVSDR